MMRKFKNYGRVVVAANILFFSVPILALASETGHDWYCPEQDAHEQSASHYKKYHSQDADKLAGMITAVYKDPSLKDDQKEAKTVEIVNKYVRHIHLGEGD